VIFVDGPVDPAAVMLRDANAALDRARAEEERALAAKASDVARVRSTRRARAMRRLKHVLKLVGGLR
jgi:hypothetical protein